MTTYSSPRRPKSSYRRTSAAGTTDHRSRSRVRRGRCGSTRRARYPTHPLRRSACRCEEAATPMDSNTFIPALRFHRLTPLFDAVVAVTVRDRAIKRRVLAHADIAEGHQVLDVGCGTGTLAIAAAKVAPACQVTGLDADPAILARARRKAADAGVEVQFDKAMSTALPYPDASFDVALSTLFFHHLPDAAKAQTAAELVRVLRPSGRLVVGDLGRPQDPLMRAAVRATVQMLDGVETTALNVRGGLPGVLADAGFRDVTVHDRFRTATGTYEIMAGTPPAGRL